ncbi:ABC transporter permease subunit [Actinomadura sp. WMMB 499]|uniref:ABC transporter permease subunit n=1 Tax=Actinomadura sp. WMMB 499 TaxID=1219491 RepID=UPI0012487BED|nr:ABC transporter permease subunit [Actinomadura sp. WMMB 499]QFG19813.1 ABC transporter permease [Actinomadura sp. WMMB 499]
MSTGGTRLTEPPAAEAAAGSRASGGGGFRGALAAEWIKLWSVRSTWWGLAGAVALMGVACTILATDTATDNTSGRPGVEPPGVIDVTDVPVGAVDLVQFVVLALAILTVTGEYATGSVRTTLQCVPRRERMLAAKASVVAAVTFPTGIVLVLVGAATAAPMLGEWGRLDAGGLVRGALAAGTYLALAGALMTGVAAMLRSAAATLTTAFLFLMVVPMTLANARSQALRNVADALPATAGRYFMAGDGGPYPAVAGALIVAVWAAAALLCGTAVLRRRDA